jgi:NAD-dependent DNA ligase
MNLMYRDEHPQQGLLTRMSTVLGRVHRAVFEKNQICDVRMALKLERQKVLEGVHLVFSRVIPLGQDPTTHELWKLAESFGARCSTNLVPGVTHLVAGDAATEKAEAARAAGISIVDPSWLRFCCAFWKKADESKFPVTTSGRVVL